MPTAFFNFRYQTLAFATAESFQRLGFAAISTHCE